MATIHRLGEDRRKHDGQQKGRKSHHQIGEAHQHGFHPATEIASADTDHRSDENSNAIGHHANDERGLRAIDKTREQVAPDQIGSEPEFGIRRERSAFERQPVEKLLIRIEGYDPWRENSRRHRDDDDRKTENRQRPAYDAGKNAAFGFALANRESIKRAHDRSSFGFLSETAGQRLQH